MLERGGVKRGLLPSLVLARRSLRPGLSFSVVAKNATSLQTCSKLNSVSLSHVPPPRKPPTPIPLVVFPCAVQLRFSTLPAAGVEGGSNSRSPGSVLGKVNLWRGLFSTLQSLEFFVRLIALLLGRLPARKVILQRWSAALHPWFSRPLALETRVSRACVGMVFPFEQSVHGLENCVISTLLRKIVGVGRAARLASFHPSAGVMSVQNLFVQHCVEMLDRALRASDSPLWR